MKKSNRKGFTIVELVIVIAVIAILAAVLIPTFSNLIKKANVSNDTAIAKNLNTAAISAQADTFAQAIEAAKEAGYLVAHLNAKSETCYFVWEDESNQFLLYDIESKKVLYSNTAVTGDPDDSWFFVVNNADEKQAVIDAMGETVKPQYLVGDVAALKEVLAAGGEVYLDESLVLDAENRIVVNDANANVIINFTNSSVSTADTIEGIPVNVINGKLTINDAIIGGAGEFENEHGTFATAVGYEGTAEKLVLNNCNITGKGNAVSGANTTDGPIYVELNNCTLSSNNVGFNMSTPGTAVLNNTNVNCPNPIFASFGANITINGGNYISTTDCLVELHDNTSAEKPTTVTIKNGEFTFTTLVIANGEDVKLVIEGGTFNCATMTWDILQQYVTAGATVVLNGTSYTK